MKKVWRIVVGLVIVGVLFQLLVSFREKEYSKNALVKRKLVIQLDAFARYLKDSLEPLIVQKATESQLQKAFLNSREYYKTVEWATEHFTYSTAKMMNGAPKPEIDIFSQTITSPSGLQVIESLLFPHYNPHNQEVLQKETLSMMKNLAVLQSYFSSIDIADWQILDAAKLEVFRIEALGLTGFDNALTLRSMRESAIALKSLQDILPYYTKDKSLLSLFFQAIQYLNTKGDFITFDRAYFIKHFANPMSRGIEQTRRGYGRSALLYNRLLRQDAFTLFDSGVFNAEAYAPILNHQNLTKKIALGKKLFYEVALSKTQTRSCASCHILDQDFANNLVKENSIDGKGLIDRNTPTLINTALQPQQFYDQRAENLEDQIVDVIHNPKEMNGSIADALKTISSDENYKDLLHSAYPKKRQLDKNDLVESLSAYIRSLVKLNSRFDSYMRGDDNAMNSEEINGFNLFMGKAQCGTCHYMPLFSGVFPPKYITQDVEIIGVPKLIIGTYLDEDRGIYNVLQKQGVYDTLLMKQFDHGFKTVSVRNMSKTAPYMHNGVFATLEDVMDFYNGGGGLGKGILLPNQSLSVDKLNLTREEIKDIIAFIHSLNSL